MRDKLFDDTAEMILWRKFVKYNRIKYLFLFFIGLLFGYILSNIIWLVFIEAL